MGVQVRRHALRKVSQLDDSCSSTSDQWVGCLLAAKSRLLSLLPAALPSRIPTCTTSPSTSSARRCVWGQRDVGRDLGWHEWWWACWGVVVEGGALFRAGFWCAQALPGACSGASIPHRQNTLNPSSCQPTNLMQVVFSKGYGKNMNIDCHRAGGLNTWLRVLRAAGARGNSPSTPGGS